MMPCGLWGGEGLVLTWLMLLQLLFLCLGLGLFLFGCIAVDSVCCVSCSIVVFHDVLFDLSVDLGP